MVLSRSAPDWKNAVGHGIVALEGEGLMTPQTLALALVAKRLSCLPLGSDKRPTRKWKHWQKRVPTASEVMTWTEADSVALITGAINRIVVVDCESMTDAAWATGRLGPTTCSVRTRRGLHLYFKHPQQSVRNAVRVDGRYDIRGDGGYVVAPMGTAYGHTYTWRNGGYIELETCPVFDLSWLPSVEFAAPKEDDMRALPNVVEQAAKYLAKCDPAIGGQGGRKQTFSVAACMTRDFGLSVAQTFDLMSEWNKRCDPMWSDTELLREIEGASLRGTKTVGSKL